MATDALQLFLLPRAFAVCFPLAGDLFWQAQAAQWRGRKWQEGYYFSKFKKITLNQSKANSVAETPQKHQCPRVRKANQSQSTSPNWSPCPTPTARQSGASPSLQAGWVKNKSYDTKTVGLNWNWWHHFPSLQRSVSSWSPHPWNEQYNLFGRLRRLQRQY